MPTEPEGATPAQITNHSFVPERDWWTLCDVCGMGEAAHATTTLPPFEAGAAAAADASRRGLRESGAS